MQILLSNDDGVNAEGINAMYQTLSQQHDVIVIAPDRNCSGMSSALSLQTPLRISKTTKGFYSVNGTPSDCVQLGVNSGLFDKIDLVVSGINHGPNLGDDTIYSGTVAAALEGRHLGYPAIAVSICSKENYKFGTAATLTAKLIEQLAAHPMQSNEILNVNVPNEDIERIKGFRATRCGKRHPAESMIKDKDPFGNTIYWYGKLGEQQDTGEDTDFYAIDEGYCSVTPLSADMTVHNRFANLQTWLQN